MNEVAEPLHIVIPCEQRTHFGKTLPCEYEFEVEEWEPDPYVIALAERYGFTSAANDTDGHYVTFPSENKRAWHIAPVSFKVEFLDPGDMMEPHVDLHLIERIVAAVEMMCQHYRS